MKTFDEPRRPGMRPPPGNRKRAAPGIHSARDVRDNRSMLSQTRSSMIARIPAAALILGGVEAAEDLIVEGQVTGHITVPDHHVAITSSAVIAARIIARSVTISGAVEGNILARERIELLPGSWVRGHLMTPTLLMVDGATFTGSVDPERTEAALLVAKYRQRRTEAASG